jgi:hypothetical protein
MVVVKASSLDLFKVTFSDVKTDIHGRKMVYVNMNNGKIMVQTPKMYAPNGIKRWRKADATNNKDDKFEMELSFYGENGVDKNAQDIREFHNKWQEFDELIKEHIRKNSKAWLGKATVSDEYFDDNYTPMVKVPKDKDGNTLPYPSRIKAKIDREMDSNGNFTGRFLSNKKFKTEVLLFDENKERIDLNEENAEDSVPKGCQVVSILELVYLSLSKTTISTKWKLVQAKVFRNKDSITTYAMLDDDEDVPADLDTDEEKVPPPTPVEKAEQEEESEAADDVDVQEDEDESEAEEVEVPVKPAAKPKGRIKRSVQA